MRSGAPAGPAANPPAATPGPAGGSTPNPVSPGQGLPEPSRAAAACRDLTIRYPDRRDPALRGVSLSIPAGQRVLLLGPSGSGKSTLALALAGLIPAVVEAEVKGILEPARQAGVLFQDPEAQFCLFTVDEEVAFGLENRCVPPAAMPARVARALAATGLDVPFGHPIHALSGGQKQRLALAAVLALEPDMLILDEPTAQLDPAGRALVLENLYGLGRQVTVLVVEHNLDGVVDWVDRVVLLGPSGTLLADGPPDRVLAEQRAALDAFGIWRPRSWGPFWVPQVEAFRRSAPPAALPGAASGRASGPAPAGTEWTGAGEQSLGAPAIAPQAEVPSSLDGAASPGSGPGSAGAAAGFPGARNGPGALPGRSALPLVRMEGVTAAHGSRTVWSGVSLTLRPGEWVAVLGANGSGKSTFLQVAAGLQPPAAGRVVHGPALKGRPGETARIGFVFQNPEHQFVTDTVHDEIALGGRLAGVPEAELAARVKALIQRFGLEGLEAVHPYTLSQGQKRRLSVASMLVVPRPLLFLDEPTFGQDARTAAALLGELMEVYRQGTTLVMATHDLELALAVATRVLVFGQGRLLYDGPPAGLADDPAAAAAAGLRGLAGPGTVPGDGVAPPGRPPACPGRRAAAGSGPSRADRPSPGGPPAGSPEPGPAEAGAGTPGALPGAGGRSWLGRVHPAWKLAAHLAAAALVLATGDPAALALLLAVPLLLGWILGGLGLRRWLVSMAPFVLVAATRIWTLGAFGRGEHVVGQVLWYRFTAEGLEHGLVVGLRLLTLGALGVLYARTTGLSELVLGLVQQWRLSPRWAYGLLAALRFVPLFQEELGRVRQAFRVRGLLERGPAGRLRALYRYSLALLVHAIRTAEVVAVALQARGFDGSRHRTYYRTLPAGWREAGYAALLLGAGVAALMAARGLQGSLP
ncbi:ATP-binding cassette domain-containing protein [Thermaerobacter sp. PB12/4term]|uniref:ATP-binding cassette domain-containing protein n=1 Tax=Thermaerobacter sp. PB12/4term TaxID=2293838 RepID=UPI002739B2DE|nr:ATP-binding cassette domain-containing protein [Thermaerobacter sp. PB12/4term]